MNLNSMGFFFFTKPSAISLEKDCYSLIQNLIIPQDCKNKQLDNASETAHEQTLTEHMLFNNSL